MSTTFTDTAALVLAAGKGTRMRSPLPKVLVPLRGRPLVTHLLDALTAAGLPELTLVVGHGAEEVQRTLGPGYRYVLQREQLGMAHAVEMARPRLSPGPAHVVVTVGDSPLLRPATVRGLLTHHRETGAAVSFLTARYPQPAPYARVVRDARGRVVKCVEERDATPEERALTELLTSHYVFRADALWTYLGKVPAHPVTGEHYLTDILGFILADGLRVEALPVPDWTETVGLNTPEEVAWAERLLEQRHE